MKANIINSFAAGILLSSTICGIVYFSTDNESNQIKELTKEEMKTSLSDDGYVILTETELNDQLAEAKKEVEAKNQKQASQGNPANEKVIYRTVINVASGMTSIDVGKSLAQGGIIKDGKTFYQEVEKRGLENKLKPGVFVVDSSMSLDEIIKTIFK